MSNDSSSLEIRLHGDHGAVETFVQPDAPLAAAIVKSLHPARVFALENIVIAGTYSLTAFVPARLSRIDFIQESLECWGFPAGILDLIELSEDEFRQKAHLDDADHLERREQARVAGDFAVGFLDVEMTGSQHVFLGLEFMVELPAERLQRIHLLLSAPSLHFRLRRGGIGILNLRNLVRFTAYPGPSKAPSNAWLAHHKDPPA